MFPVASLPIPAGDFLTIFTSMFMHAGWLHLGGNMLYLWIFGDNVEDRFGHLKFMIFYLLCGIAATFAQLAFSTGSNVPNLGASGAIAGVLGAYILMFPQGKVRVLMGRGVIPVPALIVIGLWIVLQFFSGIGSIANTADTGGVAYMAHIGGFRRVWVDLLVSGRSRGAGGGRTARSLLTRICGASSGRNGRNSDAPAIENMLPKLALVAMKTYLRVFANVVRPPSTPDASTSSPAPGARCRRRPWRRPPRS